MLAKNQEFPFLFILERHFCDQEAPLAQLGIAFNFSSVGIFEYNNCNLLSKICFIQPISWWFLAGSYVLLIYHLLFVKNLHAQ